MKYFQEKYPELFEKANLRFGIECENGWLHLIEAACRVANQKLSEAKWRLSIYTDPVEDASKIEECKKDYERALAELPELKQIKEKFGTLRIYVDKPTPELRGAIQVAEFLSAHICEHCGNVGTRWNLRWISTLCRPCAVEKYSAQAVIKYEEENND